MENGRSCECSLECQLVFSPGQTFLGLFSVYILHHFLQILSFCFSGNFKIYVEKGRKSLPYCKGQVSIFFLNPCESYLSENTGGSRELSLAEPSWAWILPWFELICISNVRWEQKSFYWWLYRIRRRISQRLGFLPKFCSPRRPWEKQIHGEVGNSRQVCACTSVHTHVYVHGVLSQIA